MVFYSVFVIVILQRLIELVIARHNERQLLKKGAYEVGAEHYPFMLLLHSGFFVSLWLEGQFVTPPLIWLLFFALLQLVRIWCLRSLGLFWNTKILILPGATIVSKGPYAYIRHPNYCIVCLELALLPLMFEAYVTAVLFTVLNGWMLSVRIPLENQALQALKEA